MGSGNETHPHVVGRYGKDLNISNGGDSTRVADENNVIIANTQFNHKCQHIVTWQSTNKNKLSYKNEPRENPIRNQISSDAHAHHSTPEGRQIVLMF